MMEPKDFQFLSLLPGLYMMRDMIVEQIQTIEARLGGRQKRKYVKRQVETEEVKPKKVASEETRQKIKAAARARWDNMPAGKKKALLHKMISAKTAKQQAQRQG